MRTTLTVKVVKGAGWYKELKGHSFEVVRWGRSYVLNEDYVLGGNAMWRHIDKEHAIITSINYEEHTYTPGESGLFKKHDGTEIEERKRQ